MFAHLHRRGRYARHDPAVAIGQRREIADGEHLRMSRQAQIRQNLQTPGAIGLDAQRLRQRRRRHAGAPDNVSRANNLAARQFDLALPDRLHAHTGAGFDAEPFELPLRARRQIGRKGPQQPFRPFDQDHPRLAGIDPVEIADQHRVRQFRKRARKLHPGRTAADHQNGHQFAPAFLVGLGFRFFKRQQDLAADAQGIVERLEAGRILRPTVVAEITRHPAEGENQVIVIQHAALGKLRGPVGDMDFFGLQIEADRLAHQHVEVWLPRKDGANRLRDVHRRESGRGDLIEQRLKKMMVLPIDQRDPRQLGRKFPAKRQPAEAGADHHNARERSGRCDLHGLNP